MDLLAASYHNVGPFLDQTITVRFGAGTHLIKSPIGSGKSFLFFDAPVFGLYKTATRPIVNRHADRAKIDLLIDVAGELWTIRREIVTTTRGGESVKSQLYRVKNNEEALFELLHDELPEIVNYQKGLVDLYKDSLEEISFSTQRELESSLEDLLPPKEVVLSVNFLLQDAENVFELAPADRVKVFKHLFGLLGIDEAKEKLLERKREVATSIKIKGDSKQFEQRLRSSVSQIVSLLGKIDQLHGLPEKVEQTIHTIHSDPSIKDLALIEETIRLDKMRIEDYDPAIIETVRRSIASWKDNIAQQEGREETLHQQYQSGKSSINELQKRKKQLETQYFSLQKQIDQFDQSDLKKLQQKKITLTQSLGEYSDRLDLERFAVYGVDITSLTGALNQIETWTQQGSTFKSTLDSTEREIKQLKSQATGLSQRLSVLDEQREQLQVAIKEKDTFYCKKIEGDCPYVSAIRGTGNKAIQTQLDQVVDQKQQTILEQKEISSKLSELEEERSSLITKIESIRDCLHEVQRKKVQETARSIDQLREESLLVDKKLTSLEDSLEKMSTLKQQSASLQARLEETDLQIEEKQRLVLDQEKQLKQMRSDTTDLLQTKRSIAELERLLTDIATRMIELQQLVDTYRQNQLELKSLREQETKIKHLYQIFSKELMVMVLQEFLPTLEEVINSYLSQMVEYRILLPLPDEQEERIELAILIEDQFGKRPVKSLSGGQKAILKLAWIMAVSTMLKSSFLCMDETINSLDVDTIGQVADALSTFVRMNQTKCYIVTHAPQIQQMDIWDSTIHIHNPIVDKYLL